VTRPASVGAVTITIGRRLRPIRCIGKYAWTARSNGARSIRTAGRNCASRILHGRSETGSASGVGTSNGGNAVLPTTTQLQILPTTALWSKDRLLLHKGKRAMLTTDQINDLHHLYWGVCRQRYST